MSHLLILYSNSPIEIAPQILLFANPSALTVDANGSATLLLTLKRLNYRGAVGLVANGLPAHVSASFSPTSLVNDEEFVTVTLNAGGSASAGTTTVQIEASGVGVLNATVDLSVTVATPSHAIDVDPDNPVVIIVQASNASVPVHVNRIGGYTGTVTPSVTGLPSGVSGSFTPATLVHPAADAVLNLTATGGATPVVDAAATVRANGSGVTEATVPLLVTVQAAPVSDPAPSGTILIDTRAGGNADIQAGGITTFAQAIAALRAVCRGGVCEVVPSTNQGLNLKGWNFSTNIDGAGTKAFRMDMTGYDKTTIQKAGGGQLRPQIPLIGGVAPTELYVQWKNWMGRTATGGGFDGSPASQIGRFAVVNEEITQNNSARKYLLIPRANVNGGGCNRYDLIWAGGTTTETPGSGTVSVTPTTGNQATAVFSSSQTGLVGKLLRIDPEWELYEVISGSGTTWTLATRFDPNGTIPSWSSKAFSIMTKRSAPHRVNGNITDATYCGSQTGMPQNPVAFNQTGAFDIRAAINQVVTYTAYVKASSSISAADGIVRVWCNGELISERTDTNYGAYGFDRLEAFGGTFEKPRWNQTEYFWDFVVWKP